MSRTLLSWLARGLYQSSSSGTSSCPLPVQGSQRCLLILMELCGQPLAVDHSAVPTAELVPPRGLLLAAVLLREKAGRAGRLTRCSAPQQSQGLPVERSGR